jgi:hypothetical protein
MRRVNSIVVDSGELKGTVKRRNGSILTRPGSRGRGAGGLVQ